MSYTLNDLKNSFAFYVQRAVEKTMEIPVGGDPVEAGLEWADAQNALELIARKTSVNDANEFARSIFREMAATESAPGLGIRLPRLRLPSLKRVVSWVNPLTAYNSIINKAQEAGAGKFLQEKGDLLLPAAAAGGAAIGIPPQLTMAAGGAVLQVSRSRTAATQMRRENAILEQQMVADEAAWQAEQEAIAKEAEAAGMQYQLLEYSPSIAIKLKLWWNNAETWKRYAVYGITIAGAGGLVYWIAWPKKKVKKEA
ncbi:MAG: hypothetical protein Q8O94_02700 [bacterium]|nr:hypothetical protein [bacterium]